MEGPAGEAWRGDDEHARNPQMDQHQHLSPPSSKRTRIRSPRPLSPTSDDLHLKTHYTFPHAFHEDSDDGKGGSGAASAAAAPTLHHEMSVPVPLGSPMDFGSVGGTGFVDDPGWRSGGGGRSGPAHHMASLPSPRGISVSDVARAPDFSSAVQHSGVPLVEGVLTITQQPAEHGRFRYSKEKRKTPISGRAEGTYPSVAVTQRYRHIVPDGTLVSVSLITRYGDDRGIPVSHWHTLEAKEGGPVSKPLTLGSARFPNLVVTRSSAGPGGGVASAGDSDSRNPEDQHVIRLLFTMLFKDPSGRLLQTRIVSDPIYGIELKIFKISHPRVPVTGGTEVFFLTSKLKKKNTLLRLREMSAAPFDPGPNTGWTLDERNRLTCTLEDLHVHYQYAVVATVPPYWDQTIATPRRLEVCLVDTAQGLESNIMHLDYIPVGRQRVGVGPPLFAGRSVGLFDDGDDDSTTPTPTPSHSDSSRGASRESTDE